MTDYSSLIGQTLSERYRLENQIGEGGQAVVWTGTDTENGQVRAIKLLPASFNTPQRMIDSFKDEGLLLVSLDDHENIVKVFDAGYDANLRAFYMIIGYVDGVTLGDLIDARHEQAKAPSGKKDHATENGNIDDGKTEFHGDNHRREDTLINPTAHGDPTAGDDATGVHELQRSMTPGIAVYITRQVALAMDHAHRKGLIHRDVKPNNILIGRNGDVKLTDFGIARLAGEAGQTGLVIGTLQYMSPEQIRGHKLDKRADIYSLGVVLYECLTGRTPFGFAERQFVPTHIVNTSPQPPVEINAEVSIPLQDVVLKALAKDPNNRYQTMAEFETALAGLVNLGLLAATDREAVAGAVAPLTGSIDVIQVDSPSKLDSNQRCATCGAPLPIGWQTALTQCPGCAGPLDQTATRATESVAAFIRQARQRRDIGQGKVGFDMAMFLYSRELQEPTFQNWQQETTKAEPEIQQGTVIMPGAMQGSYEVTDLSATAKRLMSLADFLTDPALLEYNQRLPERDETNALAAHARAKAYQLLGRYHTLRGAALAEPEEITAAYDNARHNYILAGEQYKQAADAWRKYENGPGQERIQQYYEPVYTEVQQRRLWVEATDLLAQGILRFPHNHVESYTFFSNAAEIGKKLRPTPGILSDLKVAELYDNYREKARADLDRHCESISEAMRSARQAIAEAQTADAALQEQDRGHVVGWLHQRARIALDYYHRQEDLPVLLRRIQVLARVVGYAVALFLAVAFVGEARHILYSVTNPGPFWPGWPMILAQSTTRSYVPDLGRWHFFLVMLAGIDWFIFWPFNLVATRQTPRARRTGRIRPVIPALSQLAFPIIDWLDGIARRPLAGNNNTVDGEVVEENHEIISEFGEGDNAAGAGDEVAGEGDNAAGKVGEAADEIVVAKEMIGEKAPTPSSKSLLDKPARFLFFIAPWVPVLWLSWHLTLAFSQRSIPFPGNYWMWLATLFLVPPIAGYFVGRQMLRITEKLDRLEADEANEHEENDRKALLERDRLRHERQSQATIVHDEFARANAEHTDRRNDIETTLRVLLARLLHYQKESDIIDLPGLDRNMDQWRSEVDQSFLRRMGLNYRVAEVSPVSEAVWHVDRPLNTLRIKNRTRPLSLRFVHNQDGYVMWGVDGFDKPRRARLRSGSDGYSLAVEMPPTTQQVNFMFETADHRWLGEMHTVWVEVN